MERRRMTRISDSTKLPAPHRYGCGDAHADAFYPRLGVWLPAGWGPRYIGLAVEPDRLSLLDCCSPATHQALIYLRVLRRSLRTQRRRLAMVEARERGATSPPPDGLLTPVEAARKLRCSVKTLFGHMASGALRYVVIGHGTKRPRRMFADADLDQFIANQTRKDVPCPSTRTETVARRISTTTSKCEVIGFTARRNARRAAKPKR